MQNKNILQHLMQLKTELLCQQHLEINQLTNKAKDFEYKNYFVNYVLRYIDNLVLCFNNKNHENEPEYYEYYDFIRLMSNIKSVKLLNKHDVQVLCCDGSIYIFRFFQVFHANIFLKLLGVTNFKEDNEQFNIHLIGVQK